MKEAFVDKDLAVTVRDTDVPVPEAGQILIRVVVSGINPKDWKIPPLWPADGTPINQGDDIAGYVEAVGDGVVGFKKGDKVAAFHQVMKPHGTYAEYAIAPDYTTFHIPVKTSFEEAATIPLAAMTAAVLYQRLKLPLPWNPTTGKGSAFVKTLLNPEKGDIIIDYREGNEAIRSKIKAAAGRRPICYDYDAVSEKGSYQNVGAALTAPGEITTVLSTGKRIEDGEFAAAFFQLMGRGLAQGWSSGHPYQVRPGGLAGIEGALQDLKAGRASAVKYVVRIGETDGATQQDAW